MTMEGAAPADGRRKGAVTLPGVAAVVAAGVGGAVEEAVDDGKAADSAGRRSGE